MKFLGFQQLKHKTQQGQGMCSYLGIKQHIRFKPRKTISCKRHHTRSHRSCIGPACFCLRRWGEGQLWPERGGGTHVWFLLFPLSLTPPCALHQVLRRMPLFKSQGQTSNNDYSFDEFQATPITFTLLKRDIETDMSPPPLLPPYWETQGGGVCSPRRQW